MAVNGRRRPCKNVAWCLEHDRERGLELSAQAQGELADMRDSSMRAINLVCNTKNPVASHAQALRHCQRINRILNQSQECVSLLEQATLLEQEIDEKTLLYRSNQIERMGMENAMETSILYSGNHITVVST